MARVISFYVPANFSRKATPIPLSQPGKVIEFYLPSKKSA